MNQEALVQKLKNDIAAGRVAVIAGTGVTVAACGNQEVCGYRVATWTGLLQHGAKHCLDIGALDDTAFGLLEMQIKSGRVDFLTSAAEIISQHMRKKSEGVFCGWLQDTIGKLEIKNAAILEALVTLPGIVATLNYDTLIATSTGRQVITWIDADKTQRVLRGEIESAVLHLHGSFDKSESVVLGMSSYLTVKEDPHAAAVLNSLALDRAMMLVGCGDTVLDPNFTRLIEWGKDALENVAPRHYLLCRASEVPSFQRKLEHAPWLQPLCYGSEHKDLVPFLRSLAPSRGAAPAKGRSHGPSLDFDGYRHAMRKHYGRLKLEELDPTTHDIRPLTLTGMFIAQNARECAEFMPRLFELPKELQRRLRTAGELEGSDVDEETLRGHRRAYTERAARPILEILKDSEFPRVVVLGDPGSGKSTLLQYLVLRWAETDTADFLREPLPIIVELREYGRLRHEGKVGGFLDYLNDGASVRWHFDRTTLRAWLKSNASMVLFDGLDEVFDPILRREVSTAIHRFTEEYPSARVVVTSRIIGYQHQGWRDENFRTVMLQDLEESQIADFMDFWHMAAYEDAAKGKEKRALIVRAIEDSPAIRQLAGNPLLLTMMAILNRTQELPRDRAELYEQCARLLLHQWKVDVAFGLDPELSRASLDFKDKRNLLLRVARSMQTSESGLAGNLVDEVTLEATLTEGLQSIPDLRSDRAARALIDQLRGRNFMLCSVGGHCYAFVHRTFLEFFCAVEIRTRFETEQSITIEELKTDVFGHWRDETWHEVLCLLSGMIAPRFVAQLVEWLLEQADPDETGHHVFLATRCVGEVRKRAELGGAEKLVHDRILALTRFNSRGYYEAWAEEARIVAKRRIKAVSMAASVWHGRIETLAWLKVSMLSDADSDVRRSAASMLAQRWKDDPGTLPWLRSIIQSNADWDVCCNAISTLAEGWRDDPETLAVIKALARSHENSAIRTAAAQALAFGWRDDPETLPILEELSRSGELQIRWSLILLRVHGWRNDPETRSWLKVLALSEADLEIRAFAMRLWGGWWKDDPEVLPYLNTVVRSDADSGMRRTAVLMLAQGWKDDPEIRSMLKELVRSDGNPSFRQNAIVTLAEEWKNDPETLPWVKSLVTSHTDLEVRTAATKVLARVWDDDPETLPFLKVLARSDFNSSIRLTAAATLSEGWKDDPESLQIVKALARSDESSDVHARAILTLARWEEDPETFPRLIALVRSEAESAVRYEAVRKLAGWRDGPETLAIIKSCAVSDADPYIRQTAVRSLALRWGSEAEVFQIFNVLAQSDENPRVRYEAVVALAREWSDHGEALKIFGASAMSDTDSEVRLVAVRALARRWKGRLESLPVLKSNALASEDLDLRRSALKTLMAGSDFGV